MSRTRLLKEPPSPYPGPRPFKAEEREFFFGRAHETTELWSLISAHREVLVYAQSGAGKSSLLNAALIPKLCGDDFDVLPTARVGGNIPEAVDLEAIDNIYVFATLISWGGNPQRLKKSSIVDFLSARPPIKSRWHKSAPRILLFDQFEEVFSVHPKRWKEREKFFAQLREALITDRQLRVVFVMREEYIAQFDPYVHLFPDKLRTRFRLERLGKEAGLEAVIEPMQRAGRSFASGVAETLISNLLKTYVQDGDKIIEIEGQFLEPVQLQFVCQRLWNLGVRKITRQHLQRVGNVDEVLKEFYDCAVRSAAGKAELYEGELRSWCDHDLITSLGTRGFVYKGQWKKRKIPIPDAAIGELENQHLIRAEHRAGTFWYELTHDRFVGPIRASNKEYLWNQNAKAQQVRQAVEHVGKALRKSRLSTICSDRRPFEHAQSVLKAVTLEIRREIPFEACTASIYSHGMTDARIIFSYPENTLVPTKRWFRLPKFLLHWARQKDIVVVEDLRAFLAGWQQTEDKEIADKFLKDGYISFIRYPVVRGGIVVASLSLISKTVAYTEKHKELLASLPVENALLTAVYYEEIDELKFRLELIKRIFGATSNQQIADVITGGLSKHYKWETVCMYRLDRQNGAFVLQSQNSGGDGSQSKGFLVPTNDMQLFSEGVLGKTYRENRDIKSDSVHKDPEIKDAYKKSREGANSELCMRILVEGKIVWLLNIEDSRENAFSDDEQRALRDLLNQVGALLERIRIANLISATFESTLTAVFVADPRGIIKKVNPSARNILGYSEREIVGKDLAVYLADPAIGRNVVVQEKTPPTPTKLIAKGRQTVDVLLWASHLEDKSEGFVVSLQEVGSAKRQTATGERFLPVHIVTKSQRMVAR